MRRKIQSLPRSRRIQDDESCLAEVTHREILIQSYGTLLRVCEIWRMHR